MSKRQDPSGYRVGDKVRVRSGSFAGHRGVIHAEVNDLLVVELAGGEAIQIAAQEITNHSLAARRAWNTMPKEAGRPRFLVPRKKMVSFRVDIDLWARLRQAAEFGLIASREEAINLWLREHLDALFETSSLQSEDQDRSAEQQDIAMRPSKGRTVDGKGATR